MVDCGTGPWDDVNVAMFWADKLAVDNPGRIIKVVEEVTEHHTDGTKGRVFEVLK